MPTLPPLLQLIKSARMAADWAGLVQQDEELPAGRVPKMDVLRHRAILKQELDTLEQSILKVREMLEG